ncbi:FecR family protein [Pseudoduganella flava]|uniref:DUF4880 domain-containing protein n=1 Tax=Pseudoduganella flava TaxID=871742 RepID=A0A562Q257_9BURK|nr:FecR domain-containing protein [Pseudoduganella flava]QGZ38073.1 DUF4880 domain-containing protein [Pseudoduganella flava]TWI50416.1 FecR family protein [Pseudoduganella flava]
MSDVDDQALAWVARAAAGPLDVAARAEFEAWFAASPRHQGAYLRASAIAHSLDQVKVQGSLKPAAPASPAASSPALPLHAPAHAPSHRRRAIVAGGALAAGLAAVAVMAIGPRLPGHTVFETALGEFRKVRLADQSAVSINSGSAVEVRLSDAQRRVMLTRGEAWFEVAKDAARPFIVEAGDVRVRAVGTAFSVRRHAQGADVLVTEGVVEVWANQGTTPKKRVAAGELARVSDAAEIAVAADPAEVERRLAWREGRLVFHNVPLADAVADFNRYNARQLVVADPALRMKPLVGRYRVDQPEEFANDVQALLRVPVAIGADTIRIGIRR